MHKRVGIGIIVAICVLAVGFVASPVQLSYVYSDSMEPTIDRFDGYVLVPAGDVESGDIVTFWSAAKDTHVTHRVVGRSARGFITKGDNNPSTDQATGDPYVHRDDIVGRVFTLNGEPLVVPNLGHGARFVRVHRLLIAGLLGTITLLTALRKDRGTRPSRSVTRVRDVLLPILVVTFVGAVALQVLGAHTEQLRYTAVRFDNPSPQVITVGESVTANVSIPTARSRFTHTVLGTDGARLVTQDRNATTIRATLRVPAPPTTGSVSADVGVHRYPAVLPVRILRSLHSRSPFVASTVTTLFTMSPVGLLYWFVIDGRRPLRPTRSRWAKRLRRKLGRL